MTSTKCPFEPPSSLRDRVRVPDARRPPRAMDNVPPKVIVAARPSASGNRDGETLEDVAFGKVQMNEKTTSVELSSTCGDKLANGVNGFFGKKFYALGRASASRPWTMIACTVVLCVIFSGGVGYPGLKNENRGDRLWVPTDTPAQDDKTFVDTYYGAETRFAQAILTKTDGSNVLTPEGLTALRTVATGVSAVSITWEGATYGYNDHCYRFGASCYAKSALDAFSNAAGYANQTAIDTAMKADPLMNPTDNSKILLSSVAGGVTYDSSGNVRANALSLTYLFKNNDVLKKGDYVDEKGDAFDSKVLEIFEASPPAGFKVSYVAARSFGDEFGSTINRDLTKLQIALFLILAYAALTLSKWDQGCVGSRVGVTLAGIISIGMALASAYGLGSYFGLFFSPLMNVLPFLLLGVGVDDMFVIVNAYDNVEARVDPVERMGRTLRYAGMSVTVTSITDVIAFLIGSSTSLPALKNFCYYAALGIFFDYFYQVTFFTACVALDERRKAKRQGDVFCCLSCPAEACCTCCRPHKTQKSMLQRLLGQTIGTRLGNLKVKIFVVTFFSAITIGGIIGATKIKVDADVNNFIPDGSYLKLWFADRDAYFTVYGDDVELYSKSSLDLTDLTAGDAVLRNAVTTFKANPYVVTDSVRSWVDEFYTYRNSSGLTSQSWSDSNYVTALNSWLADTTSSGGSKYKNDVVFDSTSSPTKIITSRVHGKHIKTDESNVNVKAMDTLRKQIASVSGNNGKIFPFGREWLNYEQYKSITGEAIQNLSITIAACFGIIALLVVEFKTVISVSLALVMIFVNIVGYMHFWGLTIDSVTVIMLVIALGLSVDYSAHIGRAYLEKLGTPNERIVRTLEDMGVAVWNGAMSTFMAVLILGSSDSYVFQTFFKQLFLCITLGLAHGLLFLPVLLSLLEPRPYAEAH